VSGGRARARLLAALAIAALLIAVIEAGELSEIARTTVRGPYSSARAELPALAAAAAPASVAPASIVARAD
jgi:hypothetical protein